MENPSQHSLSQDGIRVGLKPMGGRRPLQSRNVNVSSSPSPAKPNKTSKPKSNMKARIEPQSKLLMVSENRSEWQPLEKDSGEPAMEREENDTRPSIFRRSNNFDEDDEDMFSLKRANPVFDSDDEDEFPASASKRQRTTASTVLHWGQSLSEDETDGFSLSFFNSR